MKKPVSILSALAVTIVLSGCASNSTPSVAAEPDKISGTAVARDGDSVEFKDMNVDLWGVDAPTLRTTGGWYARAALDDLLGESGLLSCTVKDDSGQRAQVICGNGQTNDIGRALLLGGWAIVDRNDTRDADPALARAYANAEKRARKSRAGLWSLAP